MPPVSTLAVLDDKKRSQIIALLANGSSRRMAARYVGCAPSTITRTAARDADFARQLANAEQNAEVDALRAIRAAAKKDRYWRAAAWLLERRNPDDFAHRPANVVTGDQITQMFTQLVELLREEVPEANCDRAIEKLEELLEAYREEKINSFAKVVSNPLAVSQCPPLQHPSAEPCKLAFQEIVPTTSCERTFGEHKAT